MNKVILMGRLTRDPEVRYSQGEQATAIARYSLAVDRRYNKTNPDGQNADFINCVAIGRNGNFAEKYLRKGIKIIVTGRIQTGSYTNKDGVKIQTVEVLVEEHEFAESKAASGQNQAGYAQTAPAQQQSYAQAPMQQTSPEYNGQGYGAEGFMNIPDGIDELPFN